MAPGLIDTRLPSPATATPSIARYNALDPNLSIDTLVSIIDRDGGVILENLLSSELAVRIKSDLKQAFDTDRADTSGFFPKTTQRASGLLGFSDASAELASNKIFIDVANRMISAKYEYWRGQQKIKVDCKPIISSTVGFRVPPGGKQQDLHRDDSDYYTSNADMPMMIGCVAAVTKTTAANGATLVIPGSHKWGPERMPLNEEVVPAELEVGDALIFVGNVYHAGGANITTDQARETVGIFLCNPRYRQVENQFLEVPPAKAARFSPQVQRLLGYGVAKPAIGFYKYQDPMRVLFGVEDEETVEM